MVFYQINQTMVIIGFIIFIILIIVGGMLLFGGVKHEVQKINKKDEQRNDLISQLVSDFARVDVESYEYSLPLSVIISKASIFYAEADRGKVPSKEIWKQCVFSVCKLSIQIKNVDSAAQFYKKFIWYVDYNMDRKQPNPLNWDNNKIYFKGFLDDLIFFSKCI